MGENARHVAEHPTVHLWPENGKYELYAFFKNAYHTRFFTSILSSHVETWYKPTQKKQVPEKNQVRIKFFAYLYIFLYKMIKKIYNVSGFCHSLNMIKVFILNKKIYNV
jgi:hypothetical protein